MNKMELKPLTPRDYPALKPFFKGQRYALCSYTLNSIIGWSNRDFRPLGMIRKDALVVAAEFDIRKENRHLILPISPEREIAPAEVRELAEGLGYDQCWFVPEEYLERHASEVEACFKVQAQAAYHDYVYLTADLACLKGNRYAKKRNLIRQFETVYLDTGRVAVEPLAPAVTDECLHFLEAWCAERECDKDPNLDLACEKQAIINTFENLGTFDVQGVVLRIDGKVNAFGVGSALTHEMGVLQFEKAFAHVKGLYQYFDRECARRLFSGFTYINKENDMDLPSLARAKLSYHPHRIVKSYKLCL